MQQIDKGMLQVISKEGLIRWYIARVVSTALRLLQTFDKLPRTGVPESTTDSNGATSKRVKGANRVDWTGNRACTATK